MLWPDVTRFIISPPTFRHVVSRREWEVEDTDAEGKRLAEEERRYVRSMWAFALEESGDYTRAAVVAKKVLAEDPTGKTPVRLKERACI